MQGPLGCYFAGVSLRMDRGRISHEVYFHSKGRPVSSGLNELSVLPAFLRQSDGDQRWNGTQKCPRE